ncbi:hypothetical protein [Streptomyces caatingaensis]|uniref:hypothetical protein n=1 Tax=Streptomyces caatingaensis TaxID=1678637 RepID=UPI001F5205BD|nr:hypothetical protein [Streptomyces caatingaensis]
MEREGIKSATQQIGDLQAELHKVKDELAAVRAENAELKRQLADAQDEVIAVRDAGRELFKTVNRST